MKLIFAGIGWKFYVSYSTTYPFHEFGYKDNGNTPANGTQKPLEEMTLDELGISRGICEYNFYDLVTRIDSSICFADDEYILHLLPISKSAEAIRKPPVMVKCMPDHPLLANGTNELRIMNSVSEIVELLKPIGNATKTYESGSCVLVYFYTNSCKICRLMALPVMALPYIFKTLPVAAIDAYKFTSFNTEFGIVGLPTLILFHQGRPAIRKPPKLIFRAFVTRHTGLKPDKLMHPINLLPPIMFMFVQKTDYILIMAWAFISICAAYFLSKSLLYKQFVEMIKRNWRECEAHLEHN